MIVMPALLLSAAAPASPAPPVHAMPVPAAATAFLAAVAAHDLARARGTLAKDAQFADNRPAHPGGPSLEAFAAYVEGCRQSDLGWETDEADRTRAAVTVTWTCSEREPAQAFIWTAGTRVVAVSYFPPS